MKILNYLCSILLVVLFTACSQSPSGQISEKGTKWSWDNGTIIVKTPKRPVGQTDVIGLAAPKNGLPLDIDVYDLAEWCCLAELGELSMDNNCASVAFPDFTRGGWNKVQGYKHAFATPEKEAVTMEIAKKFTENLKVKGANDWK